MTNAASSRRKPRLFRADNYARQKVIDQMQPFRLNGGDRLLGLQHALVFTDNNHIVLSLSGNGGTVTVPMTRKTAACLVRHLTQQLV